MALCCVVALEEEEEAQSPVDSREVPSSLDSEIQSEAVTMTTRLQHSPKWKKQTKEKILKTRWTKNIYVKTSNSQ